MKKKIWIPIVVSIAILIIAAFIPFSVDTLKDGGSRVYSALAYKIIDWHAFTELGVYDKTKAYFFTNESVGELWEKEKDSFRYTILGLVTEIDDGELKIIPIEGDSSDSPVKAITFKNDAKGKGQIKRYDVVRITYKKPSKAKGGYNLFATAVKKRKANHANR